MTLEQSRTSNTTRRSSDDSSTSPTVSDQLRTHNLGVTGDFHIISTRIPSHALHRNTALNNASVMADTTAQKNTDIFRREVATGETATMDGAVKHEVRKVASEEHMDAELEEAQDYTASDLTTHSMDAAIRAPVVNSLSTTTASHVFPSEAPNTTIPARDNVLNTLELLEAIISFLPMRDILSKAQTVSRTWKVIIAQSPAIQTKLWLRTPTKEVLSPAEFSTHTFVLHRFSDGMMEIIFSTNKCPVYSAKVVTNPILKDAHTVGRATERIFQPADTGANRDLVVHTIAFRRLQGTANAAQPTWNSMHLTEPRITVARLWVEVMLLGRNFPSGFSEISASVRDARGLTLGTVMDVFDKICQSISKDHPDCEYLGLKLIFITN